MMCGLCKSRRATGKMLGTPMCSQCLDAWMLGYADGRMRERVAAQFEYRQDTIVLGEHQDDKEEDDRC